MMITTLSTIAAGGGSAADPFKNSPQTPVARPFLTRYGFGRRRLSLYVIFLLVTVGLAAHLRETPRLVAPPAPEYAPLSAPLDR